MPVATRFCHYTPGEMVAEARVTTPPGPPLSRGGKVMPRAPALSRRERCPRRASPRAPLHRGGKVHDTIRSARNKYTRFSTPTPAVEPDSKK